jgi:hypothetical protein
VLGRWCLLPFKSVVDAISAAVSQSNPTSTYSSTPERAPLSVRSNATRPDGDFALTQWTTQTLSEWWNIVCALEFKKTDGEEARDDVRLPIHAPPKQQMLNVWPGHRKDHLEPTSHHARRSSPTIHFWNDHRGYIHPLLVCLSIDCFGIGTIQLHDSA